MKRVFCYKCGKQGNVKDGLCESCYSEKHPSIKLDKRIEVVQCSKCRLIRIGGRWQEPDWEKFFGKMAKTRVKVSDKGPVKKADHIFEVSHGKERHEVTVHFNRLTCDVCGKALSGYHNAVLQLRGNIATAEKSAERELRAFGKKDAMAFFRKEDVKGGIDFLCGSKAAVKHVAQFLKRVHGAELTSSFKDVTFKDGKPLKRTIILARI